MGNLNIVFINKSRERDPSVIFHKVNRSKIIAEVCDMKMEYCSNHNIKIINTNKRAGKWFKIFEFYTCIYLYDCHDDFSSSYDSRVYEHFMIIMIIMLKLWIFYLHGIKLLLIDESERK